MGVGSVERCKGFSAHLMKMLVRQRRSLTTLTEQWIILRYQLLSWVCGVRKEELCRLAQLLYLVRGMRPSLKPERKFEAYRGR